MNEDKILVQREDKRALVDVIGRGTYSNAPSLKDFYNTVIPQGVTLFAINLEKCSYLDSTFLGTLAGLGIALKKVKGSVEIYYPSQRNLELIKNLGLDKLFKINEARLASSAKATELKPAKDGNPTKQATDILEAHQNLIDWNPENSSKFKDVISFLQEDIYKKSG